jgi:hypothetical protein
MKLSFINIDSFVVLFYISVLEQEIVAVTLQVSPGVPLNDGKATSGSHAVLNGMSPFISFHTRHS